MFEDDGLPVDDEPASEGDDAPCNSYNLAPGYHCIIYRADTPDWGAGPCVQHEHAQDEAPAHEEHSDTAVKYKLQSMKWGLIPFWTKRSPDYGGMLKTINCRDDSLNSQGGMWATMKARKRCIVVAQGFFEWLKVGSKEKLPHYVKREDGRLMCFAGLWDCVQYQGKQLFISIAFWLLVILHFLGAKEKNYTYTVITTDSNKQLKFLHDRMPVIMDPYSTDIKTWLDPARHQWSDELQSLLKPFEGELVVYPVSQEVGKVGNNSPSFVVPRDSKENKSNIANFFANANSKEIKASQGPEGRASLQRLSMGRQINKITPVQAERELPRDTIKRASEVSAEENGVEKPSKRREVVSSTKTKAKSPNETEVKDSKRITDFFISNSK